MEIEIVEGLGAAGTLLAAGERQRAADLYLEVARSYAISNQPLQAVAVGFAALQADSRRFVTLSVAHWARQVGRPAIVVLRRAVEVHLAAGRLVDACDLLDLVVSIVPRCVETQIHLTELQLRCGRRDCAMRQADAALQMFEQDGNNRAIIAIAQHILSFDARHRAALHGLVRAQMRVGEHERASQTAAVLLELDPHDPVALEAIARRMIQAGDATAGLAALRQLVDALGWAEASTVLARAQRWCNDEAYRAAVSTLRRQSDRHEVVDAEVVELDLEDLHDLHDARRPDGHGGVMTVSC